jgi:hypothetical protein
MKKQNHRIKKPICQQLFWATWNLVELLFASSFRCRKLSGYELPAISKQRERYGNFAYENTKLKKVDEESITISVANLNLFSIHYSIFFSLK